MKYSATILQFPDQTSFKSIADGGSIPANTHDACEDVPYAASKLAVMRARRWVHNLRLRPAEKVVLFTLAKRVDQQYRIRTWFEVDRDEWIEGGMSARDIAHEVNLSRVEVNHTLFRLKHTGLIDWTQRTGYARVFELKVPKSAAEESAA